MVFLWLIVALLCAVRGSTAVQLPPAFLDKSITSNSYQDITTAISLLELDDFLEVVLVGNFSQADVSALSAVLEDASLYTAAKPLRAHIYEKKIYRVSVASRVLTEKVSNAVRDNTPGAVSDTLTGYHSRLGVSTTLFIIGIQDRQDWTVPRSASSCLTILNSRAPGAAWIYLDPWSFGTEYSAQSMPQYFDGFSDAHAYELASAVQAVSDLLMPFPRAAIAPPTPTKEFVFLELVFCDSYTRSDSCPGDTVVMDTLRALDDWQDKSDHVAVKVQSVAFNIHDHPELLYALHAASHYSGASQSSSQLDMELLLYHVSKCRAVRRAISSAADLEGHNRDHTSYKLVPVFNFQLDGKLGYYARGSTIQTLVLPRWQESDPSLDYSAQDGTDIRAVVRLRSHTKAWEDLFTLGEPSPCGRVKLSTWLWNGNILFDMLIDVAWGVRLPAARGIMEVSVTAQNEEAIMMPKNEIKNDFRRGRSVDRNIIISRLENILGELHSIVAAYSVLPATGAPSIGHGALHKDFNPEVKYYEDINDLLNIDDRRSSVVDIFFNIISTADKAAVEFSHLNFAGVKKHLYSMDLMMVKLRAALEISAKRTLPQKRIQLNWNNSVGPLIHNEQKNVDDEDETSLSWTVRAVFVGCAVGLLAFFLLKVGGIFFSSSSVSSRSDPFRHHAHRSQKRT